MSFIINTPNEQGLTLPILKIPELLWREVMLDENAVEMLNTGDTEQFQQEVEELRLLLISNEWESYGFKFIATYTPDLELTNPAYYHMQNTYPAMVFLRESDKSIFSPIPAEEVIAKLPDEDIINNEIYCDPYQFRRVPAYDTRVKKLSAKIAADRQWIEDVESMGAENS